MPMQINSAMFATVGSRYIPETIATVCSSIGNRAISLLSPRHFVQGGMLLTAGFWLGWGVIEEIDRSFQSKKYDYRHQDAGQVIRQSFKTREYHYTRDEYQTCEQTGRSICCLKNESCLKHYFEVVSSTKKKVIVGTSILFVLAGKIEFLWSNIMTASFLACLVGGFLLGTQARDHHNRHNDDEIQRFCTVLNKENGESYSLALGSVCAYLRYFDPVKIGQIIGNYLLPINGRGCLPFPSKRKLALEFGFTNCCLTDTDLKQWSTAGWFRRCHSIIISGNKSITHEGINAIGKEGIGELELLRIHSTQLSDNDLKEMAQSGHFSHIKWLSLRNNPNLTSQGIAYITEKGFEGLERLDLSDNPQLLNANFEAWLAIPSSFQNLKTLYLANTDIREAHFQQLIARTTWFKKLQGIDLRWNGNLERLPPNLSELTNLAPHNYLQLEVTYVDWNIYQWGKSLMLPRGSDNFQMTPELLALSKTRKVFGGDAYGCSSFP